MSEQQEKWKLPVTDSLVIQRHDDRNLVILRLESVYNPVKKETASSWREKGYYSTVKGALFAIMDKDLLVDLDSVSTLADYRMQTITQYKKIKELLEGNNEQ